MPPVSERAWWRTLGHLGLLLAAGLAVGAAAGEPWAGLAIGATTALAWQAWNLRRLLLRLRSQRRLVAGDAGGAWAEADRLLQRRQASARRRKRRLVDMLRAYRAAATVLPDAIIVVDRLTQRIVWFNEAGTTLLGLRYPTDVTAPVVERLQPLPLANWLARGRNAEPLEVASPLQPGTTLSLRLLPYSDDLWLLVARDVSRLLALEQMRRDFVANVSHELRTPLTVLHGYLDMLDPQEQPEWAPIVAEMQRQSQRMTQLVEDLLMLSRLESRDELPSEEVVPMAGMLAALRREAQALSQGRHEIRVEDSAGVDIVGSPPELHSAFSNLVANAVRYTPEGGSVLIALRPEPDPDGRTGVALSVADTGYGIPAAHLPRITERFYRVSNSRSRESGGTGLGLSIVKHVLNLHQARLDIASEVGAGSTFSCHFTAARVRARQPVEPIA
ncbi:phosphate regulon sensor histidine kinase PhoR [Lysobacter sp. N42]|jgi:two-component system phosphate regulon sensor histidine kinase PhoR|uniref:phosphate regulon sensor histidine kinase PhoR n=1 Tax=Lysobacter sp. N42 TaxID=2545719 RepID=UPI00104A486D|nr:phosphate regulon sensor histidine kinase PhoR [Lysobacter sp. N42]TCZ87009.1 phosphate regulon sensor histidine kinase PhoR [Lysobacter sp. N42]